MTTMKSSELMIGVDWLHEWVVANRSETPLECGLGVGCFVTLCMAGAIGVLSMLRSVHIPPQGWLFASKIWLEMLAFHWP